MLEWRKSVTPILTFHHPRGKGLSIPYLMAVREDFGKALRNRAGEE